MESYENLVKVPLKPLDTGYNLQELLENFCPGGVDDGVTDMVAKSEIIHTWPREVHVLRYKESYPFRGDPPQVDRAIELLRSIDLEPASTACTLAYALQNNVPEKSGRITSLEKYSPKKGLPEWWRSFGWHSYRNLCIEIGDSPRPRYAYIFDSLTILPILSGSTIVAVSR